MSLKGQMGYTKDSDKWDRYKYDAIEYYKTDLDWFAFIFVACFMDVFVIWMQMSGIYGSKIKVDKSKLSD